MVSFCLTTIQSIPGINSSAPLRSIEDSVSGGQAGRQVSKGI